MFAVVQQVPDEGPGLVVDAAAAARVELAAVRAWAGDRLPAIGGTQGVDGIDGIDGIVVLGGPMSAVDDERHPFLAAERALLAAAVAAGLPVLGICLGAQLRAVALGGRVRPAAGTELGPGEVSLTAAGRADPVLGGGPVAGGAGQGRLPVLHWHDDSFDLPPGAVLLAASPRHPQAFRAGRHAYGIQFHVEADPDLLGKLPPGAAPAPGELDAIRACGRRVLDRFFAGAPAAAARG